jgi:hypothetical protein
MEQEGQEPAEGTGTADVLQRVVNGAGPESESNADPAQGGQQIAAPIVKDSPDPFPNQLAV